MEAPPNRTSTAERPALPGGNPMLPRIVQPSPALDAFLQPLTAHLTQPQRQHLLELADGVLVCADRKTLAALQRQFLDATDPSNWADFLRISPWSPDLVRASLRRRHLAWLLAEAQRRGLPKVLRPEGQFTQAGCHHTLVAEWATRLGPVLPQLTTLQQK